MTSAFILLQTQTNQEMNSLSLRSATDGTVIP